jgi:hypothetical protein
VIHACRMLPAVRAVVAHQRVNRIRVPCSWVKSLQLGSGGATPTWIDLGEPYDCPLSGTSLAAIGKTLTAAWGGRERPVVRRPPSSYGGPGFAFRAIRYGAQSLYRAKKIALAEIDAVLAEQGVCHRHVKEKIG